MRCAAVLVLMTGCRAVLGLDSPQLIDAAVADSVNVDGSVDVAPPAPVCAADNSLVACFDFEGNTTDEAPSPNATAASNVTFSSEGVNGGAIVVDLASRLSVQDSLNLDIPSVTIEAWVYLTSAPATASRSGVFDVNAQYAMFIRDGLVLNCTAGATFDAGIVPLNQWTHVACTASMGKAVAYINGVPSAMTQFTGQLSTAASDGGEIAGNSPDGLERMVGKLDVLRVYRVARTPTQICEDAGRSNCN